MSDKEDNNNENRDKVIRLATQNIIERAQEGPKKSEMRITWKVVLVNGESFEFTGQLASLHLLGILDDDYQPLFMTSWDRVEYLVRLDDA